MENCVSDMDEVRNGEKKEHGEARNEGAHVLIPDSYLAVDIETTGLNAKLDKIIEIGAVKVQNGQVTEQFQTLVNPYRDLKELTKSLTGITADMLVQAPGIDAVIGSLVDFCEEGLPLLGHRIMFDYSFLKRAAVNQRLTFEKNGIDTLKLCRHFMPVEEKKNLADACAYYGIVREQAHRALADAMDAHLLFQALRHRHGMEQPGEFVEKPLICKVKREQPASKKQKEGLRYLLKYHKIDLPVQIDYLTRNEISRITDKIILQYGRI